MSNRLAKLSILTCSLLLCQIPQISLADHYIPLTPHFYVQGNFSHFGFGEADFLFPAYGNPDQMFFLDATAKVHNANFWMGSFGLGFRELWGPLIFGDYLFVDQNSTNIGHYTVINPGLEYMSNCIDAHVNGYINVGDRDNTSHRNIVFQLNQYPFFKSFDLVERAGNGADAIIGYTIPNAYRARVFGGGYWFGFRKKDSHDNIDIRNNNIINRNGLQITNENFKSDHVRGIVGGIEVPVTTQHFVIGIQDSYDNENENTFVFTLRIAFGGVPKCEIPDIHDRMVDPIPRHLGALAYGTGIPTQIKKINEFVTRIPVQQNQQQQQVN